MRKNTGFVAELGVRDIQRALEFYVQILGCKLVDVVKDDKGLPFWAEVSFAETRLMFERADLLSGELPGVSGDTGKPRSALVLRLESISSAKLLLDRLRSIPREIDTGPTQTDYGSYEFSFRDPDDYVVVIAGRD